MAASASRTSSSLNGLMMAMTSFMDRPSRCGAAEWDGEQARSVGLSPRREKGNGCVA
jgi:hypothetical protein